MEKTLGELAQLFNDVSYGGHPEVACVYSYSVQMAILVEQQDQTVNAVEQTAVDVNDNTRAAYVGFTLSFVATWAHAHTFQSRRNGTGHRAWFVGRLPLLEYPFVLTSM